MIELQFPPSIAAGAVGSDTWDTQSNVLPNGKQARVVLRSKVLGAWTISHSVKTKAEHQELRNFRLATLGGAEAFRFKDYGDYESDGKQSCSPALGTGALLVFQLQKTYTISSPGTAYVRTITKPVQGTVLIYVNNVLKTETTHYTINYSTGVVAFTGGNAPANGHTVKAEFEFDKPARFVNDDDSYQIDQEDGDHSVFHHDSIEIEEVDEI